MLELSSESLMYLAKLLRGTTSLSWGKCGNNRSVMPLDVLGRTRATMSGTMSLFITYCPEMGWLILSNADVMGIDH